MMLTANATIGTSAYLNTGIRQKGVKSSVCVIQQPNNSTIIGMIITRLFAAALSVTNSLMLEIMKQSAVNTTNAQTSVNTVGSKLPNIASIHFDPEIKRKIGSISSKANAVRSMVEYKTNELRILF